MTDHFRSIRRAAHLVSVTAVTAAVTAILATPSLAQENQAQLPISVDADTFVIEGEDSMVYHELRLTQGNISLEADVARVNNLDLENSVWHLSGNVIIDAAKGHVECEEADLTIRNTRLQRAVVTGTPATFRLQRPATEVTTYGEAGKLVYDFSQGIVEFSGNATIMEGGNRISSDYLVYDIQDQRVQAAGEGDSKVKITYTPGTLDEPDNPQKNNQQKNDGAARDEQRQPGDDKDQTGGQ